MAAKAKSASATKPTDERELIRELASCSTKPA